MKRTSTDIIEMIKRDHPELTLLQIRTVYNETFNTIMNLVQDGDIVSVRSFGRFDAQMIKSRRFKSFGTDHWVQLDAQLSPRFYAGRTFRARLNGK